ncbi:hypothetical protein PILCRDRAFT_425739 [Piloderma croceum F 1598]|uniref:Uncharacterized protein n=1 Tax=Piloderma croceum (strain F 1598) TaxID=765440 RepID=A0A0C3FYW7_PILCF|nr:hypothetical protein PILCRDRAFT_425739 [Piloderma croceum F 1598]
MSGVDVYVICSSPDLTCIARDFEMHLKRHAHLPIRVLILSTIATSLVEAKFHMTADRHTHTRSSAATDLAGWV